jgi:hypothetical protein
LLFPKRMNYNNYKKWLIRWETLKPEKARFVHLIINKHINYYAPKWQA